MVSLGLENITNNSAINNTPTDITLNETTNKVGELGPTLAGTPEYAGILVLILFGTGLFKADAGTDVAGAVMIPTSLFLSTSGYLPVPSGITSGIIIGIASLLAFGLFRYAFR